MARSGIWVDCETLESKEYAFSIYAVDSSTILRDDLQGELGETLIVIDTIIPTIKYEMQRNSSARIKGILIYDQQKKEEQERFVLNIYSFNIFIFKYNFYVYDYKNVFTCINVLIKILFFRKVIDVIITFPPGIYHFITCRNCEYIISTDRGNMLV